MDNLQKSFSAGRDPNAVSDYSQFLLSDGLRPKDPKQHYFGRRFITKLPVELSRPKFLEIEACDFLERNKSEPFVLFVTFLEPHPPYGGPLNHEHPIDQIDLDPTIDHVFGRRICHCVIGCGSNGMKSVSAKQKKIISRSNRDIWD